MSKVSNRKLAKQAAAQAERDSALVANCNRSAIKMFDKKLAQLVVSQDPDGLRQHLTELVAIKQEIGQRPRRGSADRLPYLIGQRAGIILHVDELYAAAIAA